MIGGIAGGAGLPHIRPEPRTPDGVREQQPSRPEPASTPAPATRGRETEALAAGSAPEGVDPALWSVLTAEERAFFGQSRARGPLTYRPGSAGQASGPAGIPAGRRLDIRV